MIVDSSAVLAIMLREPERVRFTEVIAGNPLPLMSAASYLEVALRIDRMKDDGLEDLDEVLTSLRIRLEPVTVEQAKLARQAFQRFGRGHHPAALNFGDCLVYALAKATGEPLLFKGGDFTRTDLAAALPA